MMNMALCSAIQEGEHGASRIYGEILLRWPHALEVAYELVKTNGGLEPAIAGLKSRLLSPLKDSTSTEEKCAHIAATSLLDSYKRWNQQLQDSRGGRAMWQESEGYLDEALKRGKFWTELDVESHLTQSSLPSTIDPSDPRTSQAGEVSTTWSSTISKLRPIRSVNDPMKYMCAVQQEIYRGNYVSVTAMMNYAKGVDAAPWFGLEYFAWALMRTSNAEVLNGLATAMQKFCASRWETWYVGALKEWMTPPRSVDRGLEAINRCIVAQPTHPLVLITRAYMHVYKVKDSQLKFLVDDNVQHKKNLALDGRSALEAAREAFTYSKDPLSTASLLHIYSLLSPQIPDAKYLEILGDVEGLNPFFRRYKKNPLSILQYAPDAPITPEHIASASASLLSDLNSGASAPQDETQLNARAKLQNAHLASLYSRLLAYRSKMCIAKPALVSMGQECAEHALKLNPKNAMAHCALIVAKHTKRADWNGALEELQAALQKAETQDAQLLYRLEILQTLDKLGEPDPQVFADICNPMIAANRMDEDAVFWKEYITLKIRRAEEDATEEEEMGIEEDL